MPEGKIRVSEEEERILGEVVMLNVKVLGLVLGLLFGLVLFIATNWLVIKGGEVVGPHLQLLGQFFIGYRVSFVGSFIGFGYGFAVGALSGGLIGWIYNRVVILRGNNKSIKP